jgi:hypothetical protein
MYAERRSGFTLAGLRSLEQPLSPVVYRMIRPAYDTSAP